MAVDRSAVFVMRNITLTAVLVATGCSFTMPDAPARYRTVPDCEASTAKPVADLLGAALMFMAGGVFTLAGGVLDDSDLRTHALAAFAAGGLFTVATIDGFGKANRCRDARLGVQR